MPAHKTKNVTNKNAIDQTQLYRDKVDLRDRLLATLFVVVSRFFPSRRNEPTDWWHFGVSWKAWHLTARTLLLGGEAEFDPSQISQFSIQNEPHFAAKWSYCCSYTSLGLWSFRKRKEVLWEKKSYVFLSNFRFFSYKISLFGALKLATATLLLTIAY